LAEPLISIIIPTLNEAACLPAPLAGLAGNSGLEVIVVDGGSTDATTAIVRAAGVRLIETRAGRAGQLNTGAALATGEILLFLHADTLLPAGFASQIRRILSQPGCAAGAFRLTIGATGLKYRLVEQMVNWRSILFAMPYGDQALFLRRELFRAVGGFPELPIMEDFVFVRRLRQAGRISIARATVVTSARRWRKLGVFRTTVINQLIIIGYLLGVSPARLARWYRQGSDGTAEGQDSGVRIQESE